MSRELLEECLRTCMCHSGHALKKKIHAELNKPEPFCFAKWEPIETAPKDGTEILLFATFDIGLCYWSDKMGAWTWGAGLTFNNPTHWTPLPEMPSKCASAQHEPEPDYWHVVDEDGNSIYSSSFKEACHDHIKDAQLSDDIYFAVDVASKWVVRPLWSKPPVQTEPLSEDEIITLWAGSDTVRPVLGKNKILRFARTIEQKVRGEK